MINRFTIAVFIFLFIGIKHVYPQESRLEEIHSYKGYVLVIWGKDLLYFITSKYKNLDSSNFRARFRKENHRGGFVFHLSQDSLLDHLREYAPKFKTDSLKKFDSDTKRSILIMPVKITYEGDAIYKRKPPKNLDRDKMTKYFRKNNIGEEYLNFDNGVIKHFIYGTKYREIIDIKILSTHL